MMQRIGRRLGQGLGSLQGVGRARGWSKEAVLVLFGGEQVTHNGEPVWVIVWVMED